MIQLTNAMSIFKILPRTNCRKCGVPTCLAFAAAVFKGDMKLQNCPYMDKDSIELFSVENSSSRTLEREEQQYLAELRQQVERINLPDSVDRLGATMSGDALAIKSLGKDFFVHPDGNITSDCHVHGWITVPILNYVIGCSGKPLSGNWVALRELKNGPAWAPLFGQRCEKPIKRLADTYTDLFEFMIQIFSGSRAPNTFDSDIAVILYPLPRIPMMVCYRYPDGDLDSALNIFFDDTSEDNLNMDSIYRLAAGMAIMFEKIAITHGK